jgi:flagellin
MISIQTNVQSLIAQQDLNVNNAFQSQAIQQLSSGYRINSSADDAAGLAVANQYQSDIVELQQGVRNANDGLSQLQIVDGGLSNISTMLDRMKTLATESATSTFTGNRTTLNNEYQDLIGEITRQADNIQLNAGGNLNTQLNVYIGGARTSKVSGTGVVNINLSGNTNGVDASSLGLNNTNVLGGTVGGVEFAGNTGNRLDAPGNLFLANGSQTFSFNYTDASGSVQSRSVTVAGGTGGVQGSAIVSQLNNGLTGTGITASINATDGMLQFSGATAFTAGWAASTGGNAVETGGATSLVNLAEYNVTQNFTGFVNGGGTNTAAAENFTVSDANHSANIALSAANSSTLANAITYINAQLAGASITDVVAVANGSNTGISFQSAANFSVVESAYTAPAGTSTGALFGAVGSKTVTAATTGGTAGTAAQAAINAINAAVSSLGLVQGAVGAGENTLNYAISLAQSQVTNYTAAESQIKDADVASAAANLTKAQVLEQTSIAAMAQANSAPQAVLKLLQ